MHDPSFATALAQALETAANTALSYDPGSRQQLSRLQGKVLQISSTHPPLSLFLTQAGDQLQVFAHWEGTPTTCLRGSLLSILGLLRNDTASLSESGVTVSGKVSLLSDYQRILHNLDIDWEDALGQVLGSIPAHQLAELMRSAVGWARPRATQWPQFAGEFISEELQAVPAKAEVQAFNRSVDQVRQATDRLEARLNQFLHTDPNND